MSTNTGSRPGDLDGDLPPGVAPSFGDVPAVPFEQTPERLVLSNVEHDHLSRSGPLAYLSGPFSAERLGVGYLSVRQTDHAGEVHVHADLSRSDGPAVHLDANVRETWLARAAQHGEGATPPVRVVGQLFRLAEIPSQSTVVVQFDSPA